MIGNGALPRHGCSYAGSFILRQYLAHVLLPGLVPHKSFLWPPRGARSAHRPSPTTAAPPCLLPRLAVAKHDEKYRIVVDDKVWKNTFDLAWQPVFSPGGSEVAVKIERNGKYSIAVNDRLWDQECDAIWDPVFSPGGNKILLKTLQGNVYSRRVISIEDILG